MDKKFLADNYKRMSDKELLYIISNEANELTDEAKEILHAELKRRGLDEGVDKVIVLQGQQLSGEQIEKYFDIIRNQSCPKCSSKVKKLNAAIIYNTPYEDFVLGCPVCLVSEIEKAKTAAIGFGLLGRIRGSINAINQLAMYDIYLQQIRNDSPTEALKKFVIKRFGEIELYQSNPERMATLLKQPNSTFS